jgi:ABC-2 type transport system permease protein
MQMQKKSSVLAFLLFGGFPKRAARFSKVSGFWVKAVNDLRQGWRDYRELWLTVGRYDIVKRYRRSVLGPFWITFSIGIFIVALSLLYGPMLGRNIGDYIPYLTVGLVGWRLISDTVSESCNIFVSNGATIRQLKIPLSIYVFEMIWRNVLILIHNLLLYVVVVVMFWIEPTWATLLFIPGLAFVCLCALWTGLLLGTVCARFRDVPPIVSTIMPMMFLVTPVLWKADHISEIQWWLVTLNPFYYFLELIRTPLLGTAPSPLIWVIAFAITLTTGLAAIPIFSRFHDRIVYWV